MEEFDYSEQTKQFFNSKTFTNYNPYEDYDSPISIVYQDIYSKIAEQIENDCVEVVQHYGFKVNKEELFKALKYDRNQYIRGYNHGFEKGFAEATQQLIRPTGEWVYNQYNGNANIGNWHCSNCGEISCCKGNFCPDCGAKMQKGENNENHT